MTTDWLSNLQDLAGEHPEAAKASAPPTIKEKRSERAGMGSLDLGKYQLSVIEGRIEGEPLVEGPARADGDGLGNGKKRIHLRLSEDLERFIFANTRGSNNAVIAAMIVFAFQEMQRTGKKLVLSADGSTLAVADEENDEPSAEQATP